MSDTYILYKEDFEGNTEIYESGNLWEVLYSIMYISTYKSIFSNSIKSLSLYQLIGKHELKQKKPSYNSRIQFVALKWNETHSLSANVVATASINNFHAIIEKINDTQFSLTTTFFTNSIEECDTLNKAKERANILYQEKMQLAIH